MAKRPETSSPQGLVDRTMYEATFGANLFRDIAEQGLDQSKAVLDGYMSISKKAVESADRQATRSMLIAEETLSNAYDFAHQLVTARDPTQLATLQTEFVRRQAEIFADQLKDVSQNMMHEASEVAAASMRVAKRSKRT
jgi:hypothetical protein